MACVTVETKAEQYAPMTSTTAQPMPQCLPIADAVVTTTTICTEADQVATEISDPHHRVRRKPPLPSHHCPGGRSRLKQRSDTPDQGSVCRGGLDATARQGYAITSIRLRRVHLHDQTPETNRSNRNPLDSNPANPDPGGRNPLSRCTEADRWPPQVTITKSPLSRGPKPLEAEVRHSRTKFGVPRRAQCHRRVRLCYLLTSIRLWRGHLHDQTPEPRRSKTP